MSSSRNRNSYLHSAFFVRNRAWTTKDSKIFIWDYDRFHPHQWQAYDGLGETIVSVSLAVPKPGVFVPDVNYILVIATTTEVSLLAVKYNSNDCSTRFIPTTFVVSSDGVLISTVVGTQSGRIFMAGRDGGLYELCYDNEDRSWASFIGLTGPSHKCRKINRDPLWSRVWPPPMFKHEQSLDHLCVDNDRNLLYGVTSGSLIRVLDIKWDNLWSMDRIFWFDLKKEIGGVVGDDTKFDAKAVRVAGIFAVSLIESKHQTDERDTADVILVLACGARVHLRFSDATNSLEIRGIKGAPPLDLPPKEEFKEGAAALDPGVELDQPPKVFNANGIFIQSFIPPQGAPQGVDNRLVLTGEMTTPGGQGEEPAKIQEDVWIRDNIGNVKDIKEACCATIHDRYVATMRTLFFASKSPTAGPGDDAEIPAIPRLDAENPTPPPCPPLPGQPLAPAGMKPEMGLREADKNFVGALNELVEQGMPLASEVRHRTQREILVLTDMAVYAVRKKRPVERLLQVLSSCKPKDISDFFKLFGKVEACSMCLEIWCGLPPDVALLMVEAQRQMGVDRVLREHRQSEGNGSQPQRGEVYSKPRYDGPRVIFSYVHDALKRVLGRFLRPIWLRAIAQGSSLAPYWRAPKLLTSIRTRLEYLKTFIDRQYGILCDDVFKNPSLHQQQQIGMGGMATADTQEVEAVHRLWRLIVRSSHALRLIEILGDTEETDKVKISWADLGATTFRTLVVKSEKHNVAKKLVEKIVQRSNQLWLERESQPVAGVGGMGAGGGGAGAVQLEPIADRLVDAVKDDCYAFFSAADFSAFKASLTMDSLDRMGLNPTASKQFVERIVIDLVQNLLQASLSWTDDTAATKLETYCTKLAKFDTMGRKGLVHLCLATAENFGAKTRVLVRGSPFKLDRRSSKRIEWYKQLYHTERQDDPQHRESNKKHCRNVLLEEIRRELPTATPTNVADTRLTAARVMIEETWEVNADEQFQHELCWMLLERNKDELLRIKHAAVMNFLKINKKEDVLFR